MDDQTKLNGACRQCGCTQAMAGADALAIGFLDEFVAGTYTCCQVVQWADEQWGAWEEAGRNDGKAVGEVTSALEIEPDPLLIPVYVKKRKSAIDPKF